MQLRAGVQSTEEVLLSADGNGITIEVENTEAGQ